MKNIKSLIFYIIIFQIIFNVNCQYIPAGRSFHTLALVKKKIFFLGGKTDEKFLNDFFYLDISKPFDKTKEVLPFVNLTDEASNIPPHNGAAMTVFGGLKDSIFFFGGDMGKLLNNNSSNLAYSYNTTQSSEWEPVLVSQGFLPIRRRFLGAIADNKDKIYLFGGGGGTLGDSADTYYNIMSIFDNTNKIWINGTIENTLIRREGHTATFLPDTGIIIYIGGYSDDGIIDITNIDVYNTTDNTWNRLPTKDPPEPRYSHTAVLTNDSRIIVFGGIAKIQTAFPILISKYIPVSNYYEVLNINTLEWYHGKDNPATTVPYRGHGAVFVDGYMFITFGNVYSNENQFSNDVFIYKIGDYANFTEVTTIYPETHVPTDFIMKTIVIVISITVSGIIIILGSVRYHKFRKLHKHLGKRPKTFVIPNP